MIPMGIGLLSAGQTIQSKQGIDFFDALKSGWGFAYWISRGLIPAGTYIGWYFAQNPQQHSFAAAVLCGLGSEAVLRAKLYLGQQTRDGKAEDVFKGVFDLIDWYQAHSLKRSGIVLAERRRKLVIELLGTKTDFQDLSRQVIASAAMLNEDEKIEVRGKTADLLAKFKEQLMQTPAGEAVSLHKWFVYELGYALLRLVGKRGLAILLV